MLLTCIISAVIPLCAETALIFAFILLRLSPTASVIGAPFKVNVPARNGVVVVCAMLTGARNVLIEYNIDLIDSISGLH